MAEVVLALLWREVVEQRADAVPQAFAGAFSGFSQQVFEFGEDHLDRVEVGAVGRQEEQRCAAGRDEGGGFGPSVAGDCRE